MFLLPMVKHALSFLPPFMVDSDGESGGSVQVVVKKVSEDTYRFTYVPDRPSCTEYAYTLTASPTDGATTSYIYSNSSWGDLLTSYQVGDNAAVTITSDSIGNMTSDGMRTYTWEHGRELHILTKDGITWTNTYNADGLRTKRASNSTTYSYVYNGSSLSQMSVGTNLLNFVYDASGSPMAVVYNGTPYYYVTNLQGDVVAILDSSGADMVKYTYNAWGQLLTTTGTMATTLGVHNPLRYRGYVYDTEYSLYYLQSRYYDPQLGRFINADALTSTGKGLLGSNTFLYCANNPVNYYDLQGKAERPVGAGVQIEGTLGHASVGIEIILYWDVEECVDGAPVIAIYIYGGVSVDVNDYFIASIVGIITDNADLLLDETGAGVMAVAALIGEGLSVSVSGVLVVGNDDFTSTTSYEKSFTSMGAGVGKIKGSVAYSESCTVYSLGYNVIGGSSVFPSSSVSKTYYQQVWIISLGKKSSNLLMEKQRVREISYV